MDCLDLSQVEIKASRDTKTGFITLDHSCKKNPKRPQIEASRRRVQEMQRIRIFGNDNGLVKHPKGEPNQFIEIEIRSPISPGF